MRKRLHHEPDNRERWLVSYADFITLLFAFFVVMYSISSVNEGKYKVLSESLHGVFNAKQRSVNPIEVGENRPVSVQEPRTDTPIKPIVGMDDGEAMDVTDSEGGRQGLMTLATAFQDEFADLIEEQKVEVSQKGDWLEVSVTNTILFESGGVEPIDSAMRVVERIARVLNTSDNGVLVEGHTDNVPIRGSAFPTNWELSAARAASVVRYLGVEGIAARRMGAVGYGEQRPIARNDTQRGRDKNRRVVLLISKNQDLRESILD